MEPSRTDLPPTLGLAPVPLRVLAYVVDVALLAAFVLATQWTLAQLVARPAAGLPLDAYVLATVSLPVWLYFAAFESRAAAASPGKRLLRLHVAREDGTRLSFARAFARAVLKVLPWEVLHATFLLPGPIDAQDPADWARPGFTVSMLLLGSWLATTMLTPKQQGVHDLFVATIVRRDSARAPGTV